jgi:drug/metabolite transporter (DMT)-like permease
MNSTLTKEPSKALVVAAFAAVYIIWGSTYLGILYALQSIPPFFMMGSRFVIAGVLLLSWCLLKGEKLPPLSSIGPIALAGVLMLFVGNGAVTWVEQYLPSGLAAIIVATVPLWFVLLDRRQWSYHFSNKGIITGLLVGFAGVLLLFSGKNSSSILDDPMKVVSFFVLIAGTIGWATGSLFAKYKPVEGSTIMKVALQMLTAGGLALLVGLFTGEQDRFSWSALTASSVWALAYLIVMGSIVGYLSYVWLLSVRPPSLVGTYAYVNPIIAVSLGWAIASEPISQQQVLALTVILAGVLLVNFSKEKKPVKSESPKSRPLQKLATSSCEE